MLAVPAAIAGCTQRIVCTPPNRAGEADAAVLVAAHKAGATRIFKVGGAQAVAALAYGTDSIPKCDKIFGPGNAWVTAAKQAVAGDAEGAAFDLPAGPSEVLVIADEAADASFVAADLLAQAEHSPDAQALLVTVSAKQAQEVALQISRQVRDLSRREILAASVANIRLIVTAGLDEAFRVSNAYAPEHLIVQVRDARSWLPRIEHAGAVFLGDWSPESVGDYCSGPNHTLPTYGFARAYSGLGLEDFQKRITVQELSRQGLRELGPATETLAAMEGLDAHARAVSLRLASARA
jgi:histidinol dehydrogenase